jgi:bifunctional enzyme CysN/CysC
MSRRTSSANHVVAPPTDAHPYVHMDLLRLTTAGSVDDGKSTLIGRLLYDTKSIFEDQLEAVERTSRQRGEGYVNLALLTDGLRAEREQNITIDVAYRYFATPKRKFIIADTPGHVQYTRNMVTGASSAELAIILVDARKGVQTQSKRHGFIASLLGIPHLVVAVNKMDLTDFSEDVFEAIRHEYTDFAAKLNVADLTFIPVSALLGDNIVDKSDNTPWYDGPTLLHHLESVSVGSSRNLVDFRFPVQYVIRPSQDFRGYAGRIASGTISPGEEVVALPSGNRTRIRSIETMNTTLEEAAAGQCILLTLEDEIDLSRGEMIVRSNNVPLVGERFDATICWMSEEPLDLSRGYLLMHTTRDAQAYVSRLHYRINVDTLHREETQILELNDIARVEITASKKLFFDPYETSRETGGFILIDPHTRVTVAAGMIRGEVRTADSIFHAGRQERLQSSQVVWEEWNIPRNLREERSDHLAAVIWLTGLSGSGKSTIARELERRLFEEGIRTMLLDGDQVRHGLCADLGFSAEDRTENIRRVAEVARLFFEAGHVVICTFVSPFRKDRDFARSLVPQGRFLEVFIDTPLDICRQRDPKGLYAKADAGEIRDMTGISSPYEPPETPEAVLTTLRLTPATAVDRLVNLLSSRGLLRKGRPET